MSEGWVKEEEEMGLFHYFISIYEKHCEVMRENLPLLTQLNPDSIHDARVTSRRIRSLLTEFIPFLNKEIIDNLNSLAKQITRLLGKRREIDVIGEMFANLKNENVYKPVRPETFNKIIHWLGMKGESEKQNCFDAIGVIEQLLAFPITEEHFTQKSYEIFKNYSKLRVTKCLKKIKKLLSPSYLEHSRDYLAPELHELRIVTKKSRYRLEVYQFLYPEPVKYLLDYLKQIQEQLGLWNDYRVLLMYMDAYLMEYPESYMDPNMTILKVYIKRETKAILSDTVNKIIKSYSKENIKEIIEKL